MELLIIYTNNGCGVYGGADSVLSEEGFTESSVGASATEVVDVRFPSTLVSKIANDEKEYLLLRPWF